MRGGYIRLGRGMLNHPRFKPHGPYSRVEAWVWLIEAAAFKDHMVSVTAGRQRKMVWVSRGELTYSIRFLADAWSWSPNRVQRFVAELQSDGSIETRTETGQTLIFLCNYDTYQAPLPPADTQTETGSDTQSATNKKEGKGKNKNTRTPAADIDAGFGEWYALYPRKKSRAAALKAYRKVIDGGKTTHADLVKRTREFAAECAKRPPQDRRFIPYPASWLNDGGYLDEPEPHCGSAPSIAATATLADDFTDADWRKRLEIHAITGSWAETEWGPAPGKPGCLVPPALSQR